MRLVASVGVSGQNDMMMFRSFPRVLMVMGALLAGACAQVPPPPVMAEITFAHLSPYNLAVGSVEVESQFTAPLTPPHAEHKVPQAPETVMRRWAADRLVAAGGEPFVRFVILDATVTEHALETDGTLTAVFTNEQALRYEAIAEGSVEVRSQTGAYLGNASVRVTRAVTIPENASLNEREKAQFDLVDRLMQNFNTEMDANIRAHLKQWLN